MSCYQNFKIIPYKTVENSKIVVKHSTIELISCVVKYLSIIAGNYSTEKRMQIPSTVESI